MTLHRMLAEGDPGSQSSSLAKALANSAMVHLAVHDLEQAWSAVKESINKYGKWPR